MAVQVFQVGIKALIRNEEGQILMVHIPEWNGNPAHWDFPGGRIDEGEGFIETLRRELKEELDVDYKGTPKQLTTLLTSITIPSGNTRLPLIFVIYEVKIPKGAKIRLDPNSSEDDFRWFTPIDAAKEMAFKLTPEFCDYVRTLSLNSN